MTLWRSQGRQQDVTGRKVKVKRNIGLPWKELTVYGGKEGSGGKEREAKRVRERGKEKEMFYCKR